MWIFFAGILGVVLYSTKDQITDTIEEHLDSWTQFDYLFKKYGARYGVDWQWLKAIALNESDLGKAKSVASGLLTPTDIENSKSFDGKSWGLMQVTLATARDLDPNATAEKLNNAEYSVNLAAKYLSQLKEKFSQADPRYIEWVIKSYNQGPGNTLKERSQVIAGYANGYWNNFKKNLSRVQGASV